MPESQPSTNGANGRGAGGRFAPGNVGGPGNPHAKRVAKLRSALLRAIKPDDIKAVVEALIQQARGGDVASIRELLLRAIGPPTELDLLERLEALEDTIKKLQE